jgi:hypothetical protein
MQRGGLGAYRNRTNPSLCGWFEMGLVRISKASMAAQMHVEISTAKPAFVGIDSQPLPDNGLPGSYLHGPEISP